MNTFGTKNALAAIALVGGLLLPSAVSAGTNASQSFTVGGVVPVSCEINATSILANEGDGFSSGTVFESCNSQEGFQVVAQHRWLEDTENVMFNYAGQTSQLRKDGWSLVANRLGAKHGRRFIGIRHSGLVAPLSIGLTITAF
ncbi:MAG: hypothetical protein AAGE05_05365 [Pseudomonadota bacterium]